MGNKVIKLVNLSFMLYSRIKKPMSIKFYFMLLFVASLRRFRNVSSKWFYTLNHYFYMKHVIHDMAFELRE